MLLLTFILIYIFYGLYLERENVERYCISILSWIMICYTSNEILSVFSVLDRGRLIAVYGIIDIGLLIVIYIKVKKKKDFISRIKSFFCDIKNNKLSIAFAALFGAMLILAGKTVPYNWDSMTYHLPRIMQWAQNKSVAHYLTHDVRQLTSPVLAEFVNLQVYVLTGKADNIFNLLQCFSFITNAILVFYITKKLKVSKPYCWLSMLLFVSMPIAFGEALSTQVDHFSTIFLLIFVYFILDLIVDTHKLLWNKENILYVIVLSLCIGLGYLAKPSVMFGMVFFAVWLLVVSIRRKDALKDVIYLIVLAGAIIIVVIAPEILRNIRTFHALSDPIAGAQQLVGTLNPLYLVVNGLKNYAMNLPNVYVNFAGLIEHGVYWIAYMLGVNIHDRAIAENGIEFYLHLPETYGHDTAINPIVVISATIAIMCLMLKKIRREKYDVTDKFSLVVMGAFLFFCIVLRWEPFVTRYMLSYLALLCPVVAIWLWKFKASNSAAFVAGMISLMCMVELANLFAYHGNIVSEQKGDISDYFVVNGRYIEDYKIMEEALDEIDADSVGLYLVMAAMYEYPIWKMVDGDVRIEPILVENTTIKYEDDSFLPEVIIVMNKDESNVANYKGHSYVCYKRIDDNSSIWCLER